MEDCSSRFQPMTSVGLFLSLLVKLLRIIPLKVANTSMCHRRTLEMHMKDPPSQNSGFQCYFNACLHSQTYGIVKRCSYSLMALGRVLESIS